MTFAFALFNASTTTTAAANMQPGTLQAFLWGEAGNGGLASHGVRSGAGGGGGAFGADTNYAGVTPGSTLLTLTIGTGGQGQDTILAGGTTTWTVAHGTNAAGNIQGTGGAAGSMPVAFKGGDGAPGVTGATQRGSGGGGSGGQTGAGGAASTFTGGTAGPGGTAPTGQSLAGQPGANGPAGTSSPGIDGATPGAGASGGSAGGALNMAGGNGAPGQILLVWTVQTTSMFSYAAMPTIMTVAKHAVSQFKAYLSFTGGVPQVTVPNQWAGKFSQPASFQSMPPALQSVVVPLTPATSTGGGSGTPTPGTWLFCLVTLNEPSTTAGYTIGVFDDTHGWWRPGNELTSTWASSTPNGLTRTMAWYIPNTARQVGKVYVAPNGSCESISVSVIEISGLGPWDVVTGISTGYAAAGTTLNLALPAPSAPAFVLAVAGGDSTAAGQALAPSGWSALHTVTSSNGVDHTADSVLTGACTVTSGAVSVNATATSATDLSGVIIGVQVSAASPIPAGNNPIWPYLILEAAFGSGFQTPQDQRTWTSLNNWTVAHAPRRFWQFADNTGVPYAQGQLNSGTGGFQLDNFDGALSPWNTLSPYAGQCLTGVPIRIRAAIGTMKGAQVNRWFVIERNALGWPEKRNESLHNYVPMTTTDTWTAASLATCPTPYRGEVLRGTPQSWWPMDDQPGPAGVLPTTLRNAAAGNSNPISIVPSPVGVSSQDGYSTTGTDLTALVNTFGDSMPPPSVATYAVGAQAGWMYGDPQSSPASAAAGGAITATPGSAAWQQTGMQGNTGSNGWFLAANDPAFPALATGAAVEGWFNFGFAGSAAGVTASGAFVVAAQPVTTLTLFELATATAPVAILYLDTSGHLILETFNGATGTNHTIYSGSDLRCAGWFKVTANLTATTWEVRVNGGLTADQSGTATGMTSAWTWLIAGGDLGSAGGSSLNQIQHGSNVSISHLAVYPQLVPAWLEASRYQAAIAGFGLLPAPTGLQFSTVSNQTAGGGNTPDGTEFQGSYGLSGGSVIPYTFSAVAVATAGSFTSGPSARAVQPGIGKSSVSPKQGYAVWAGWTSISPIVQLFTSASAATETEAASCLGAGDSFTSGYGSGASGHGVSQVAGGTGASPPTGPTPFGDTVAMRFERVLGYANYTSPSRAIDPDASLLVQAANDVGGQGAGSNLQALTDSDNGLMFVDLLNTLSYWSRPHLASDQPVWQLGMNPTATRIPFKRDIGWSTDPQRVYDAIDITPYSPDGSTPPAFTPSNAAAVAAAQLQNGVRPKQVTSYLQDQSKMQAQADWFLATYGTPARRAEQITIDAASHPLAWVMWFSANVGDICTVFDLPIGGMPTSTGNYRISQMSRSLSNGANGNPVEGKLTIVLDPLPASYWS